MHTNKFPRIMTGFRETGTRKRYVGSDGMGPLCGLWFYKKKILTRSIKLKFNNKLIIKLKNIFELKLYTL
jgi:hypothetical protein